MKSTPVVMLNEIIPSKPKEIILVPKTSEKVIQLVPAPAIEGKSIFKSKSLASANELVVVYRLNGKNYYQTLGKLKQLEPAILP
ncbi:MAG TPA: hypothetical protein VM368_01190 [Flavisolibacter sp.]|nr:hypothetical protein [Flavisolibacter sp.]